MATFPVDPPKAALLVIDMQNCFVENSPFAAPEGPKVLDRLNALSSACRARGIQVIHTVHVVRPDHTNVGVLGEIMPPVAAGVIDDGSESAELHPRLEVEEEDVVLKKPRFGAFHGTDLEPILRSSGIDTLIIGGIATNVCAETTAREANARDFKVLFLSDGTATFGLPDAGLGASSAEEVQRVTCNIVGFAFGEVLTVADAMDRIGAAVPAGA